jgi:RNA polymerase sigma-70 factor (ECF subfamily)
LERRANDWELMLQARDDDERAFAELMRRYRPRLIRFFRDLSRDETLAEDLFQETFIRIWGARKRYLPSAQFSTYLIEIAKNLWLSERPRWKRRVEARSLADEGEDERPDALRVALRDVRALPEEELLRKERDLRIASELENLPPDLRLTFVLARIQGFKYREIAEMQGIPEGTVKWRMSEANRRLREKLRDLLEE